MALSKPCEVKIWTSSHGTDYHHFPSSLSKAFKENTHPKRDLLIKQPYIDAIPGRQMKEKFVKDFKFDFERIPSGTNRISIIMMGGNDIRCNAYLGACRIERHMSHLIELHKDSRHGLIVCGLLPSPVSWKETSSLFHRVSNRLYKQVEAANNPQHQKIAYLQLNHVFLDEKGLIEDARFFDPDRIHLNPTGAFQLAKHLIDSTIPIVETFFPIKSSWS